MRYAIISDIHANQQALKAVFTDIRSIGADSIICLGDIVGYGPSPAEVLEITYSNVHHFVLGNHDAVIGGMLSSESFNNNARYLIEWTASVLDRNAVEFFKNFPLVLTGDDFRCTHGEFNDPGRFGYILETEEASSAFAVCEEKLLFAGHSHQPGIFVIGNSRVPHWIEPFDFSIEPEKRYIVNVGSVGQPRDNDIRACYCIFDTDKKDVFFRKVPFDIDAYCEDLKKSGLSESSSYFVGVYKDKPLKQIREILDFRRVSEEKTVKTNADVKSLEETVRILKKSRLKLFAALLVLLFSAIGLAVLLWFQKKEKDKVLIAATSTEKNLQEMKKEVSKYQKTVYKAASNTQNQFGTLNVNEELLKMPEKTGIVSESNLLDNWTVILSDLQSQNVSVEEISDADSGEASTVFRMKSDMLSEMEFSRFPIPAKAGMRFTASASFKKICLDDGYIGLYLEYKNPSGAKKILKQNIHEGAKNLNTWTKNTPSVTLGKREKLNEDGELSFVIRGQFKGEVLIKNCSLKRIE